MKLLGWRDLIAYAIRPLFLEFKNTRIRLFPAKTIKMNKLIPDTIISIQIKDDYQIDPWYYIKIKKWFLALNIHHQVALRGNEKR